MARYGSILETVGIRRWCGSTGWRPPGIDLWVKVEAFNPLGSVKDRLALGIIQAAEASGELKPGQTVVEATSGNTGIGLAMVCAAKGYPLVVIMAESFSVERRRLMRFLGAKVVLTPAAAARPSAWCRRRWSWPSARLVLRPAVREPGQPRHALAHHGAGDHGGLQGRAARLLGGRYGTGGTLNGVARVLAKERPDTQIVVCEPDDAPLLGSGAPQARNPDGSPPAGHPAWKPHPMQGWTPDFIPKITGERRRWRSSTTSCPSPAPMPCVQPGARAARRASSSASPPAPPSPGPWRCTRDAPPGAQRPCLLPDTGERLLLHADSSPGRRPDIDSQSRRSGRRRSARRRPEVDRERKALERGLRPRAGASRGAWKSRPVAATATVEELRRTPGPAVPGVRDAGAAGGRRVGGRTVAGGIIGAQGAASSAG